MLAYHASPTTITTLNPDICLTDNPDAATGYLRGEAGTLHTIEIDDNLRLADEDDLHKTAEDIFDGDINSHFGGTRPYTFQIADDPDVQAELVRHGYAGTTYGDVGEDNAYEHNTIRIFDTTAARIVNQQPVTNATDEDNDQPQTPTPVGPTLTTTPAATEKNATPETEGQRTNPNKPTTRARNAIIGLALLPALALILLAVALPDARTQLICFALGWAAYPTTLMALPDRAADRLLPAEQTGAKSS